MLIFMDLFRFIRIILNNVDTRYHTDRFTMVSAHLRVLTSKLTISIYYFTIIPTFFFTEQNKKIENKTYSSRAQKIFKNLTLRYKLSRNDLISNEN